MTYGHWNIRVTTTDGNQTTTQTFPYPVGFRGPVNSAATEREAIAYCRRLGGEVKGPFFYQEERTRGPQERR